MNPYLICSILMAIVAYLAYTQGHINGENKGREDVLKEELVRLDMKDPCCDKDLMIMLDNMDAAPDHSRSEIMDRKIKNNNRTFEEVLSSIEAPTEQPY